MFDEAARSDLEQAAGKPGTARAGLARLTTIGCGGGAAFLLEADSPEQLAAILEVAARFSLDRFVLGLGSNLLVADSGWDGLVIRLSGELKECRTSVPEEPKSGAEPGVGKLVCGGGASLPKAASIAADAGLSGLEPLAGIPGTVGGGVAMNAGAWGTSIGELVQQVIVSMPGGVQFLKKGQLKFSYRHAELPEGSVVSSVVLELKRDDPEKIRAAAAEFRRRRAEKQPAGERSYGSVFRNPGAGPGAGELQGAATTPDAGEPQGGAGPQSAGELLDKAGCKGLERGAAAVSQTHANFIINRGGCSAADVIWLMDECRRRVHEKFGVILEPEVKFLGDINLKPLAE
ncbi:MAG: UDP-N-acetylmuramate dehydrogenase [Actinobacteria bacterium]|nr:UDP-N-acetylmuramate dehydrogenase [Actinomycetota bacterium]